jgi:long-chain alkane monooxygenase
VAADLINETRDLAESFGRRREDIKFFQGLSLVVGSTEQEARQREEELNSYLSPEAFLAHANLGVSQDDGRPYPPETLLADISTNGGRSHIEWMRKSVQGREPTVADLGRLTSRRHPRLVGTPDQIADGLEAWRDAGVDGINLINFVLPGSYREFADHVLPVLQRRGLAKREYAEGSLRRKIFGEDYINERHPAAQYRGAFSPADHAGRRTAVG